jgi:hypothetical protein
MRITLVQVKDDDALIIEEGRLRESTQDTEGT